MRPAPGPLTVEQGGASELGHADTEIQGFIQSHPHMLGLQQDTERPRHKQMPHPHLVPTGSATPLPRHEPLTKPWAYFAESLSRPLSPLWLLPSNESKQETDPWASKAKTSSIGLSFC